MIEFLTQGLSALSETVQKAFWSLPSAIITLLIIALVIILITIILVHLSVKRAARNGPPPPSAQEGEESNVQETEETKEKLPPYGGWISEFLTRRGYFHVSTLSLCFLKALEFFKKHVDSLEYKYRLPWYLVVGPSGSGKTTWLESANIEQPFGSPDFSSVSDTPPCKWFVFGRAVMIDIRGEILIDKNEPKGDDKSWRSLLVLLSRYRSARPLNGIVLTLPATELYGKGAFTREALADRASAVASKLMNAQNSLGIRIPIYVVITKTDILPGFQSLCAQIPSGNRTNMLGWSSPYTLSTAYSHKWVDEIFYQVNGNLNQLRIDILADNPHEETRDGVFVFPSEIMRLKDPLSVYLNQIFKNDGFNEPLMFRGIYFTGDSGMEELRLDGDEEGLNSSFVTINPENVIPSTGEEGIGAQLPEAPFHARKRTLFFGDDILKEKVFSEYGLANPIPGRLVSINRALNVAKISTGVFIFLGTYGLFSTYEKFKESRNQITPMLLKMNIILRDLNQNKMYDTSQTSYAFDIHARQLIEMMTKLQQTSFTSVFVPASWFSNLQQNLNESLKIAYQQIVIRTLYIDLLLKARDLLHLRPTEKDVSPSMGQLLQPTISQEFMLVKRFVEGLETLEHRIKQFNALKTAADPTDLNELVQYTFQTPLPPAFIEQYGNFRSFLRGVDYPPIDLKPYTMLARETLNILYQNFLNAICTVTAPGSLPARLNHFMVELSQKDKTTMDLDWLRRFSLDLAQAKVNLGEPGKTWMDAEHFNPGRDFDGLFDKIDNHKMFGRDVSQFLIDQTAIAFQNLKMQLQVINQSLSEFPADPGKSLVDNRGAPIPPSQGVLNIEKSLSVLFSEPYMAIPTAYNFVKTIPPGKMIYWDAKIIQLAHDMAIRFEDFRVKNATGLPPALSENLMILARQSLQQNIMSLIGRAQNFVDYKPEGGDAQASEEILRTKVMEMRETSPKFTKLLEVLNQGSIGHAYIELRTLLFNNTIWLVEHLDRLKGTFNLFAVRDPSFSWWDGKPGASFGAYSAKDAEDLRGYIGIQKQQINVMALDFAKPLITFLTSKEMASAQGDRKLINKWKRIIEQVEAYDAKQPGNSLGLLEDFVTLYMTNCDVKMCLKEIKPAELKRESGDFFLEILRNLRQGLLKRAEILRRKQAFKAYQEIAAYYNKELRGTFPFVGMGAREDTPDADPTEIQDFFKLFEDYGGSANEILDQVYQLGPKAKEAYDFLKNIENIRSFFQSFIGPNPPNDLPTFDLKIDFRVNRSLSRGDDLIVDWGFKPNDIDLIQNHDTVKNGTWTFAQPVEVRFRWPDGETIPANPAEDSDQPYLKVSGKEASFVFSGQWSLLWLLRAQGASKQENKDPNSYTLKFTVPTGNGKKAIVFNQITLMSPSPNPKKPGKVLRVPDFPGAAPALPPEIFEFENKPVFAEGSMKPYWPGGESPEGEVKETPKEAPKEGETAEPKKEEEESKPDEKK